MKINIKNKYIVEFNHSAPKEWIINSSSINDSYYLSHKEEDFF